MGQYVKVVAVGHLEHAYAAVGAFVTVIGLPENAQQGISLIARKALPGFVVEHDVGAVVGIVVG